MAIFETNVNHRITRTFINV